MMDRLTRFNLSFHQMSYSDFEICGGSDGDTTSITTFRKDGSAALFKVESRAIIKAVSKATNHYSLPPNLVVIKKQALFPALQVQPTITTKKEKKPNSPTLPATT